MSVRASGSHDLELVQADDVTVLPLMLARPRDAWGGITDDSVPRTLQDALTAQSAQTPLAERIETTIQETWIRGIGLDYTIAPGVYTRTDQYALAAGLATTVTVPSGAGFSSSPLVAFAEFNGDLYVAQTGDAVVGGRVCKSVGGTGALAPWTLTHADYVAHPTYLTTGEYVTGLCVFDDGGGTRYLYAASADFYGLHGRLHRTLDGTNWASTNAGIFGPAAGPFGAAGTAGRGALRSVHWKTNDGSSGWRLVTISRPNAVAFTIPNADPFLAASWVEDVKIGTNYQLLDIAAARSHVWFSARDGLFDLDEMGNSPNLIEQVSVNGWNGLSVQYLNGYVYQGMGAEGLHRVKVDSGAGLQESPGVCRPGWNTQATSSWLAGFGSALTVDQGCIVYAAYNFTTVQAGIFWGIDREIANIDSPNPIIWHGPEVTLTGGYRVNQMHPSGLAGGQRLWVAALGPSNTPLLAWVSLPSAGAPLDDLLSGGPHRFKTDADSGTVSPYARIEMLPQTNGDRNALKVEHQAVYSTRGLDANTSLTVFDRADPAPASQAWGTGRAITTSPTQTLTPSATLQGYSLQQMIQFHNANTATPGVLDAVRSTRWKIAPDFRIRAIDVEYGDGVVDLDGAADDRNPEDVTAAIRALTRHGRTVMRDNADNRWTVKVGQVVSTTEMLHGRGEFGKTVRASLRIALVDDIPL